MRPAIRCATTTAGSSKVKSGEPGLLLSKVSNFQPFDGYTDKEATEKKLVRDAFKEGDVWFNTGDLMRSQGFGHAAFADRLGDTFRWKGENVATTEVEHAVSTRPARRGGHGVRRRGRRCGRQGGHGGDPAQRGRGVRRQGAGQDGLRAPAALRGAVVRAHRQGVGEDLDVQEPRRSTCASRATAELGEGDETIEDPIYVLKGRDEGYVEYYDEYPDEVKGGKAPKSK